MNRSLFTLLLFGVIAFTHAQSFKNIVTEKRPIVDTFYNDYILTDNYRWLEDVDTKETRQWVDSQNKRSKRYLSRCIHKTDIEMSMLIYSDVDYDLPELEGKYTFGWKYDDSGYMPSLIYWKDPDDDPIVLVEPKSISTSDEISISGYYVSPDSKTLIYKFNRNGSEWTELKSVSLENGIHNRDHLKDLKVYNFAWKGEGFFYSTFPKPDKFGKNLGEKVFYHKLGDDQSADELIFMRKNPSISYHFLTSQDQRYFILKEDNEQHGIFNVFYIDFESDDKKLKPLMMNLDHDILFYGSHDAKLIASTHYQSNNGSIILINPENPFEWQLIPPFHEDALLVSIKIFKDKLLAIYRLNQHPVICIYNYDGELLYSLELPFATSVSAIGGGWESEKIYFYFESYTIPPVVYTLDLNTFEKELVQETELSFSFKEIVYEEKECLSFDGLSIPFIMVYDQSILRNGTNPTLLSAYGGFGIVSDPGFDPCIVDFIKKGGIYVYAHIRGGGEKGKDWEDGGKGFNKSNSFRDFISVAEYLIDSAYTSQEKLAITGGSNGGLVVASAAIQRPDLFKLVIPKMAPSDMLRLEDFTVGHFNIDEFGTVHDSLSFCNLLSYSPYQNIIDSINYPTMLIYTAENDERVPPWHSYKFAAELQSRSAQINPILLKTEKNAGHFGATKGKRLVREYADIYSFIMHELGMD